MQLWKTMYLVIWLGLLEFLIVMYPVFDDKNTILILHLLLGLVLFFLAVYNYRGVTKANVPRRIRGITGAYMGFVLALGIIGILRHFEILVDVTKFLHIVASIATITQMASAATAYDMWEDREFENPPPPAKMSGEGV